jgi:hypothetical protein
MKLSAKEAKLISQLRTRRKHRKWDAWLIHVYFAVRPDDKLIDLLQRYVNRDPEAIVQVAGVTTIDGC